jgi:hypothetical protein
MGRNLVISTQAAIDTTHVLQKFRRAGVGLALNLMSG